MEFLTEYGLFLAKTATLVVAVLIIVFFRPGVTVVPLVSIQLAWQSMVLAAAPVTTRITSEVELSSSTYISSHKSLREGETGAVPLTVIALPTLKSVHVAPSHQ